MSNETQGTENKINQKSIFNHIIERLFYYVLSFSLLVMLVVVGYQVISRKIGWQNNWTEELSRWMFVWSCLIGAAYFMYKNDHLVMDLINEITFLGRINKLMEFPLHIAILIFNTGIAIGGGIYAVRFGGFVSGGLRVPCFILYLSCPVAFGFSAVFEFINIVTKILIRIENLKERRTAL